MSIENKIEAARLAPQWAAYNGGDVAKAAREIDSFLNGAPSEYITPAMIAAGVRQFDRQTHGHGARICPGANHLPRDAGGRAMTEPRIIATTDVIVSRRIDVCALSPEMREAILGKPVADILARKLASESAQSDVVYTVTAAKPAFRIVRR